MDAYLALKVLPALDDLEKTRRRFLARMIISIAGAVALTIWELYRLDHPSGEPVWTHVAIVAAIVLLCIYAIDRLAIYQSIADNRLVRLAAGFYRDARYVEEVLPEEGTSRKTRLAFLTLVPGLGVLINKLISTRKAWRASKWRPDFGIVGKSGDATYALVDFFIPGFVGCALSVRHPSLAGISALVVPQCPPEYMAPASLPPENRSLYWFLATRHAGNPFSLAHGPTPLLRFGPDDRWRVLEIDEVKNWHFADSARSGDESAWEIFTPDGGTSANSGIGAAIVRRFIATFQSEREPVLLISGGELVLVNTALVGNASKGLFKPAISDIDMFRDWTTSFSAPARAIATIEDRYDGPIN